MMAVADKDITLILTGNGDVLEPVDGIAAIGSGGNFALAAARALIEYENDAETLARKAMAVAADICVYTNDKLTIETLDSATCLPRTACRVLVEVRHAHWVPCRSEDSSLGNAGVRSCSSRGHRYH